MKHWEHHPEPVDGCFGCKGLSLQMNAGDAKASNESGMTNKEWDNELKAYRHARAQGIQPAGTSMKKIREAMKASETLGKPYNADTMPQATSIHKKSVSTLKEIGAV